MPYLIDGHNLIAAMPGMSLADSDDEQALLEALARSTRVKPNSITVYFDHGSLLAPKLSKIGGMRVHFVRPPRTADDALVAHILRIGREAPNWTVVSSDGQVRRAAQAAGARVMSSQDFARELTSQTDHVGDGEKPEPALSDQEVEAWETIFKKPKPASGNKQP